MKKYNVTGMSCAACSARIEKAVSDIDGVTSCSVNLLTNSMVVEGDADDKDIIAAVEGAGYGIDKKDDKKSATKDDEFLKDRETPILKKRLFSSLVFLVVLMYVSMGHTMLQFPLPSFFDGNYIAIGILQMLLALVVMVINKKFFISGFKSLVKGAPNMDTLVALGSGASFIYSVCMLFLMTDAQVKGNIDAVLHFMHEFYFESCAMILALITVGKMLESYSKGKTTNAIKGLMDLTPKTAVIIADGVEKEIPVSEIKKGDIFIVKPGGSIPADGVIIEGYASVDESNLTGESIPVDKGIHDTVSAATVNKSGYIKCEAINVGDDTTISQIIKMVSDASSKKAPIAKVADKVSGVFVPAVIIISFVTVIGWLLFGESIGFALQRGISVLVISCPCALGLATPVAIMVGSGVGAKNGILFKTSASLEKAGRTQIVALDKTGTITEGKPMVTDIVPALDFGEDELLQIAYSLEVKSEHPLSEAIVKKAEESNIKVIKSTNFEAYPGNGLGAIIGGKEVFGGNKKFISEKTFIDDETLKTSENLASKGKTPLFFTSGGKFMGIIAVADTVKEDSAKAIKELKNMGMHVVMLTGDNERTANAVKETVGIDEVMAGVLPSGKESVIRDLKKKGKTLMVGDGINDAPALTSADTGVAIGAGCDIAIDAADIVLMKNSLLDVASLIRLSRQTLKNIYENLFWAFVYNVIGIPLAMGLFIPLFNLKLNPMFGAAAMSLSSFCVVSNALRLNLFNIRSAKKDKKIKNNKKEKNTMEKIIKIEGMMCGHCSGRVKNALEEIDGVSEAIVSHEENNAVIKLSKDVPYEILKKTVEDAGYKVIG